jgi:hypothetical protein
LEAISVWYVSDVFSANVFVNSVKPTDNYTLIGYRQIFVKYPFLLPCLLSAGYNLVASLLALCFLPETNLQRGGKAGGDRRNAEEEPLLTTANTGQDETNDKKDTSYLLPLIVGQGCVADKGKPSTSD